MDNDPLEETPPQPWHEKTGLDLDQVLTDNWDVIAEMRGNIWHPTTNPRPGPAKIYLTLACMGRRATAQQIADQIGDSSRRYVAQILRKLAKRGYVRLHGNGHQGTHGGWQCTGIWPEWLKTTKRGPLLPKR